MADLKKIYTAINKEAAEDALKAFEVKWGSKYAGIKYNHRLHKKSHTLNKKPLALYKLQVAFK